MIVYHGCLNWGICAIVIGWDDELAYDVIT